MWREASAGSRKGVGCLPSSRTLYHRHRLSLLSRLVLPVFFSYILFFCITFSLFSRSFFSPGFMFSFCFIIHFVQSLRVFSRLVAFHNFFFLRHFLARLQRHTIGVNVISVFVVCLLVPSVFPMFTSFHRFICSTDLHFIFCSYLFFLFFRSSAVP